MRGAAHLWEEVIQSCYIITHITCSVITRSPSLTIWPLVSEVEERWTGQLTSTPLTSLPLLIFCPWVEDDAAGYIKGRHTRQTYQISTLHKLKLYNITASMTSYVIMHDLIQFTQVQLKCQLIHCLHDFAHKQDSQLNSSVLITVWRVVIKVWQDSQLNSSAFSHCSVWRVAIGKGV